MTCRLCGSAKHTERMCELGYYVALEKAAGKRAAPRARVLTDHDVETIQGVLRKHFPDTDWEHVVDWQTLQDEMERGEYDSPYEEAWTRLVDEGIVPYDPRDHFKTSRLDAEEEAVEDADAQDTIEQDTNATVTQFKQLLRDADGQPDEEDVRAGLRAQHPDAYAIAVQELDDEARGINVTQPLTTKKQDDDAEAQRAQDSRVLRAIMTHPDATDRGAPWEELASLANVSERELEESVARHMDAGIITEPILGRLKPTSDAKLPETTTQPPAEPSTTALAPPAPPAASQPIPASQRTGGGIVTLDACALCDRKGAGKLRAWLAQRASTSELIQICAPCSRNLPPGYSPAGADFPERLAKNAPVALPVPVAQELPDLATPSNPNREPVPIREQDEPRCARCGTTDVVRNGSTCASCRTAEKRDACTHAPKWEACPTCGLEADETKRPPEEKPELAADTAMRTDGPRSTDPDVLLAFYSPSAGVTREEAEKAAKLNALPLGTRAGKYVRDDLRGWKSTLKKDKFGFEKGMWSLTLLRHKPELAEQALNPPPPAEEKPKRKRARKPEAPTPMPEPAPPEPSPPPTPASSPRAGRSRRHKTRHKTPSSPPGAHAVDDVVTVRPKLDPHAIVGNLRAAGAASLAGKQVRITAVLQNGGRTQYRARALNGTGEYRFAPEWLTTGGS